MNKIEEQKGTFNHNIIHMFTVLTLKSIEKVNNIVNNVLNSYEMHYNGSKELTNQPLEDWDLASLEKAYGFAMAIYSRLPDNKIQNINISRALQLPLILECFIGSCTTEYSDIMTILNKQNIDTNDKIEFDPDSLWSLISLSTWIYDYLKWILREWYMLFHCKKPNDSRKLFTFFINSCFLTMFNRKHRYKR